MGCVDAVAAADPEAQGLKTARRIRDEDLSVDTVMRRSFETALRGAFD